MVLTKIPCKKSQRCIQVATILGGSLVFFPTGILMFWGNLSVYANSYFYNVTGDIDDTQTPWAINFFSCWWSLGIFVSSLLLPLAPLWVWMLLGIAVYSIGNVLSCLALSRSSLLWFNSSFILMGLGNGFTFTCNFVYINEWADDRYIGLVTVFVLGSFQTGAVVVTQFATAYINPLNESPDLDVGTTRFFTQTSVLANVPSAFVILCIGGIVCQLLGMCLMRTKQPILGEEIDDDVIVHLLDDVENGKNKASNQDFGNDVVVTYTNGKGKDENQQPMKAKTIELLCEVLSSRMFYVLFFVLGSTSASFISFFNNFKAFGNSYIIDDYFLSNLATIFSIISIGARLFWGFLIDKQGARWFLIIYTTSLTFLLSTYYFTPSESKWLYYASTILLAGFNSGFYTIISLSILGIFKREYYSITYGLLLFSEVSAAVITPFAQTGLLKMAGWLGVFGTQAVFMAISSVMVILWFPSI